jgi:hypothetical protein
MKMCEQISQLAVTLKRLNRCKRCTWLCSDGICWKVYRRAVKIEVCPVINENKERKLK